MQPQLFIEMKNLRWSCTLEGTLTPGQNLDFWGILTSHLVLGELT